MGELMQTLIICCAEHRVNVFSGEFACAEAQNLFGAAIGYLALNLQPVGQLILMLIHLPLILPNPRCTEVGSLFLKLNRSKIEPLASAENCDRNLFWIGGAKDEFDVFRRFLKCLQQCIKGRSRQHVDFVNVDLEAIDLVGLLRWLVGFDFIDAAIAATSSISITSTSSPESIAREMSN